MRLLISGASGFIGQALVAQLCRAGHSGVCVSRRKAPFPNWSGWEWLTRAEVFDRGAFSGIDALLHLEVKQHVQNPSKTDVSEFEKVNVNGTREWLAFAERSGIRRMVFFSSIKAASSLPRCQDETDACFPDTAYGRSKLAAEGAVTEWTKGDYGRSAIILRPAVVYGPGNQANMLSLVRAICRNRYFLIGENDNVKSLISLKNLTAAVCHLLTLDVSGPQIYYVTDRESFTVAQIAAMIRRILNDDRPFRRLPLPIARLAACAGDIVARVTHRDVPLSSARLRALIETTHFSCAKLMKTGFVHPESTHEGVEEMVKWCRVTSNDVSF